MSNKRITDVDYTNSLNGDESFFVNQNNSIKQISRENIVFDIVNGGTGANTAAGALKNLGITATAAELNKLDGVTASTAELNYVDGVTSNIQTQFNDVDAKITNHTHTSINIEENELFNLDGAKVELVPIAQMSGSAPGLGGGTGGSSGGEYAALSPSSDDSYKYSLGSMGRAWDTAYIDNLELSKPLPISMGGTGTNNIYDILGLLNCIEIVNAKYEEFNMDEVIGSGEGFKIYDTNSDTKGTPRTYGMTTLQRAIIFNYSTGSYGAQLAMSSGGHMWHRRLNNGNLYPWTRVTTQQLLTTEYGDKLPDSDSGYTHSATSRGTIFYKKVSS